MPTFQAVVTLDKDGTLVLQHLPFHAGDRVQVTVSPSASPTTSEGRYPLRGTVLRFDHPFEPAAENEWEAGE
jgi:hypothetical protein